MIRVPPHLHGFSSASILLLTMILTLVSNNSVRAECTEPQLFGVPIRLTTGPNPLFMVARDFNEDGLVDFAVTNSDFQQGGANGSVAILIGTGVRTFAMPVLHEVGASPVGILAGDFDEDGIIDLAVANKPGNSILILRGLGSGGVGNGDFAPAIHYPAGAGPFLLFAGDFNHDGITDLAAALNDQPGVSVLPGLGSGSVGNGSFGPPIIFPLSNLSTGISGGDLNGDGHLDLVATEYRSGTVGVLLGTGSPSLSSGSFAPASHHAAGSEPFDVIVADFNEDGRPDLAVGNTSSGGTAILIGSGAGSFGAPSFLNSGNDWTTVDDFNQDGMLDIAASNNVGGSEVRLFLGQGAGGVGNGTFGPPKTYPIASPPYATISGDFDGDGHRDLLVSSFYSDFVSLLPGTCSPSPPDTRSPFLTGVRDVPNDQGGRVFLTWNASSLDVQGGTVNQYRIWRQVPTAMALDHGGTRVSGPALLTTRTSRSDGVTDIVYWESIATLPAQRLQGYGFTAPTTQDSMQHSNPYIAFFVTAITSNVDVFYSSNVDSGYSVDNIPPHRPRALDGNQVESGVALQWDENEDADLSEYRIYRGATEGFTLTEASRIAAVTDARYVDEHATGGQYYKLTAVDRHGNESQPTTLAPLAPTQIGDGLTNRFELRGAIPNPSRTGALAIHFSLPARADTRLEVMDLAGRKMVSRDLGGLAPGDHAIVFGEREPFATGVYLIRLVMGTRAREAKAVVIR